jgi:hypothetical protein
MCSPELIAYNFDHVLMRYYINALMKTAQAHKGKMLDVSGAAA